MEIEDKDRKQAAQEPASHEESRTAGTLDPAGDERLLEAQAKIQENWDLFVRAKADADNLQRRARLDLENAHKFGVEKFAKELLMVADSLQRGLEAVDQAQIAKDNPLREGLDLTFKLLLDTFDKFGIKTANPINEPFNPSLHEALSMQTSQTVAPNHILSVIQQGFTLHGRVLRPARVIVSRAPLTEDVQD